MKLTSALPSTAGVLLTVIVMLGGLAPAPAAASDRVGGPMPASDTRADSYARDLQQAREVDKDYGAALAAYDRLIREAPYHGILSIRTIL